jgi:type I restriction enzyme S subunit
MSKVEADKFYPFDINHPPRGWIVSYIKDVAEEIRPGFASGKHNSIGHGIPHIRPMNIDRQGRLNLSEVKSVSGDNSLRLRRGDVLFNNTNSPALIGKTTAILRDDELAFSNHMTRLQLRNGHDPRFIAHQLHYLWSRGYFRHRCVNHVNQASISKTALDNTVPLLLAPQDQQQRIVAKIEELFSDLDAGVAALERVQANLQRYRASVLKAAVEGRLTQQWRAEHPDVEPADQLLQRILHERREKWEQDQLAKYEAKGKKPPKNWKDKYKEPAAPDTTNLPELPKGWCWATAQQLTAPLKPIIYGILKPGPHTPDGVPYVRVMEMKTGTINVRSLKRCNKERAEKFKRATLSEGDILVSKDGTIGKVAIVPPELEGGNITQHVLRFSASPHVLNCYIARAIEAPFCQAWMKGETKGVALQGVNVEDFRRMPIPLPPAAEQAVIADEITSGQVDLTRLEKTITQDIQRSGRLRQAILKRAFEGSLTTN